MDDAPGSEMELMITAADLRQGQEEVIAMLERLARTFELTLPENTEVRRGGWFFSKEKPVEALRVDFGEQGYGLVREGRTHVRAAVQKRVRGVVLKTSELSLDDWMAQVAAELSRVAQHNARAREAFGKFTRG